MIMITKVKQRPTGLLLRQMAGSTLSMMALLVVIAIAGTKAFALMAPGALRSMGSLLNSPGVAALSGKPYGVDSAGGFTLWKFGMYTALGLASWAVLQATKLTRRAEDDGTWDQLVVGRFSPAEVYRSAVFILFSADLLIGLGFGVTLFLETQALEKSVLAGASFSGLALFSTSVGLVTSELLAPRRRASITGMILIALTFVLRMVADGAHSLSALRWATPFGWLEEVRSFGRGCPMALLIPLGFAIVFTVTSFLIRSRRDIGSGSWHSNDEKDAVRVRGIWTLAVSERVTMLTFWALTLFVLSALLGLVTKPLTDYAKTHAQYIQLLKKFGEAGGASAKGFIAITLMMISVALAFMAVSSLATFTRDELSGRLDSVVAIGPRRSHALLPAVVVTLCSVVLVAAAAVLGTYLGFVAGAGSLTSATLVASFEVLLIFPSFAAGLYLVMHSVLPRAAFSITVVVVVLTVALNLLGPPFGLSQAIIGCSLLHHIPNAPVVTVTILSLFTWLGVASAIGAAGVFLFEKREIWKA